MSNVRILFIIWVIFNITPNTQQNATDYSNSTDLYCSIKLIELHRYSGIAGDFTLVFEVASVTKSVSIPANKFNGTNLDLSSLFSFYIQNLSLQSECKLWKLLKVNPNDSPSSSYDDTLKWLFIAVAVLIVIYGIKLSWLIRCKNGKKLLSDILKRFEWDDITPIKYLDAGNFGEVWLASLKKDTNVTEEVVYKIRQNLNHDSAREYFLEEAMVLSQLQSKGVHKNIIRFEGMCIHDSQDLLVFEYMNGGNCINFISKNHNVIQMHCIGKIIFDVLEGCIFLQDNQYVHRDIAARNVLLSIQRNRRFVAKLADFGLAKDLSGNKNRMYTCSTSPFNNRNTAPEGMQVGKFDVKSDVWSFGVLMWELFKIWEAGVRVVPYDSIPDFLLKPYVCNEKRILLKPSRCPQNLYENVMKVTWNYEPDGRPDFIRLKELLNENWREHRRSRLESTFSLSEDMFSGLDNVEPNIIAISNPSYEMNKIVLLTEVPVIRSINNSGYLMHSFNVENYYLPVIDSRQNSIDMPVYMNNTNVVDMQQE